MTYSFLFAIVINDTPLPLKKMQLNPALHSYGNKGFKVKKIVKIIRPGWLWVKIRQKPKGWRKICMPFNNAEKLGESAK